MCIALCCMMLVVLPVVHPARVLPLRLVKVVVVSRRLVLLVFSLAHQIHIQSALLRFIQHLSCPRSSLLVRLVMMLVVVLKQSIGWVLAFKLVGNQQMRLIRVPWSLLSPSVHLIQMIFRIVMQFLVVSFYLITVQGGLLGSHCRLTRLCITSL